VVGDEELFGWALSMVCSRGQSMGDGRDAACGFYPLLDMANCSDYPDPDNSNAEHFNLPQPQSQPERDMRDAWYRQAGVGGDEDMEEDRLLLQARRAIPVGEELNESCYTGKSDLELLFYFGFVPQGPAEPSAHGDGRGERDPALFLERQGQLNEYYGSL